MKLILIDDANKHHSNIITGCVLDPKTPVNILGFPALGTFFGDNADATDPLTEYGPTIKLGSTKPHFIWDHGRHERHIMQGYIYMPELYLYVGHGYFKAFCTRFHNFLSDKVKFTFSSAYSIYQHNSEVINLDGPHVIAYNKGYLYSEDPLHQWYCPENAKTTICQIHT